jgi:anti-anti-sigma factor
LSERPGPGRHRGERGRERPAPATAAIEEERSRGVTVVALAGEVDLSARDALDRALASALERGQSLVVDLSRTTLIDSTILGVLIAAHQDAEAREADLAMVVGDGPSDIVRSALRITGVDRVIAVHGDRAAALAAVAPAVR